MSEKTLNLTIEESIKERAKRIAISRGINTSRLVEQAIIRQEDPKEFTPKPGSVAYRIYNLIPETEKVNDYNYKKLKEEALREKSDL